MKIENAGCLWAIVNSRMRDISTATYVGWNLFRYSDVYSLDMGQYISKEDYQRLVVHLNAHLKRIFVLDMVLRVLVIVFVLLNTLNLLGIVAFPLYFLFLSGASEDTVDQTFSLLGGLISTHIVLLSSLLIVNVVILTILLVATYVNRIRARLKVDAALLAYESEFRSMGCYVCRYKGLVSMDGSPKKYSAVPLLLFRKFSTPEYANVDDDFIDYGKVEKLNEYV